jgi:hypothetical protein
VTSIDAFLKTNISISNNKRKKMKNVHTVGTLQTTNQGQQMAIFLRPLQGKKKEFRLSLRRSNGL